MRLSTRLLVLLPLLFAGIAFLALTDQTPLVQGSESISQASIAEAKRLLTSNDPRSLQDGDERTAVIPATLIDAVVNHLASHHLRGRGAFMIGEETAEVRLSVPLLWIPARRYLNLRVVLLEAEGEPRIVSGSIGSLPIPGALTRFLVDAAVRITGFSQQWQSAKQAVRRLAFEPARATVDLTYVWEPRLLERVRSLAFTADDIRRLEAAQKSLAGLLDHHASRARVSLARILPPLLTCCGETVDDHRAALLVLATYLAEKNLALVVPEAQRWTRPRRLKLILRGREDSAQHFGISAALVAWAGEPAANAIGLYKEIDDSRAGSGFSFADLAADRAGTSFGELVVAGAPRLQKALQATLTDADLAPPLNGLPEYLSEADFKKRFGNGDNAAYQELTAEIERRLAALPWYR